MVQSKKQLENDFVYWMDKSQGYSNAIQKLSGSADKAPLGVNSSSLLHAGEVTAEKKRLQKLKTDADLCAREIQHKISALSNNK